MSTPVLKPNSSWFAPTVSAVKRSTITTINIVDSYTPSTTPTDSWDASVAQDGSIMCYVEGAVLTIDGAAYAPEDVPNLTHSTYYASHGILPSVVWDKDSKKYMHLAAMRLYHDLINTDITVKLDTLREEIGELEEASTEEIHALFV